MTDKQHDIVRVTSRCALSEVRQEFLLGCDLHEIVAYGWQKISDPRMNIPGHRDSVQFEPLGVALHDEDGLR
jgi:hypothetical protein